MNQFLNKMERKFGRFAIRGLMYYIIILNVAGAVLGIVAPGLYGSFLQMDVYSVLHGQVWRLVTFILYPSVSITSPMSILFFGIEMYLYYMIGNTLERNWGAFRFNLYYLSGIVLNILVAFLIYFILGLQYPASLEYVNQSLFLAFAVMFPNIELLLFFVIPVKMKWLGIAYAAFIGYDVFRYVQAGISAATHEIRMACFLYAFGIIVAMLNFIIFFLCTRNYRQLSPREQRRRRNFKKQMHQQSAGNRHRCAICGRTEEDNPNLEFRYCSKCAGNREYCSEHLFTHEHVK